jgi:hypothetical protein
MRFSDFTQLFGHHHFPRLEVAGHPERVAVLAIRMAAAAAVQDPDFLLDCVALELEYIKVSPLRRGLAPFFIDPDFGVRFAFGYWAPGATPGPHEHTAWTITAVITNELDVQVFDREQSHRRGELVPKTRFTARAGQVGYIYDPCIHSPKNISHDWSLSLHLTSPRDGEAPIGDIPELGTAAPAPVSEGETHPYRYVRNARSRQNHIHELARLLSTIDSSRIHGLIRTCSFLASASTRDRIRLLVEDGHMDTNLCPSVQFVRTHRDLAMYYRRDGDLVTLFTETEQGPQEEFSISDVALDAIAFVIDRQSFDVPALPGNLSYDERMFVAESLEEAGLFRSTRYEAT